MNHSKALGDLRNDATEVRLAAARYLAENARRSDKAALRAALNRESVPWIKRALQSAIQSIEKGGEARGITEIDSEIDVLSSDLISLKLKMTEEIAAEFIHEISPIVGALALAAPSEIADYQNSRTRRSVEHLQSLLRAIRELKNASSPPTYSSFSLPDLVSDIVHTAQDRAGISIAFAGPARFTVSADPDRLRLAIVNGYRNAIEAVLSEPRKESLRIIFTWGSTQTDNYLAIKDTGPGFIDDPAAALKQGSSSKEGHLGFGLSLAQQAMLSMQGEVTVKNYDSGAHFEIRWFRKNADSVR
ncbi:HAMP domain-containing histidine kinase [Methylorubrum sp. B1-46]|uniref:sensor histidine kinase n=1 Tax=Methylorubrum sp. B1-46 TaxID=2897334 RepID=UPI001E4EC4E1|nr:HAMP domain-containing sensor histidine kinase [Methylorubrum sp. B1-46]UGB27213.1 HAMP domain-containing histidine kinase [Methylorubrum sp. B1-46]